MKSMLPLLIVLLLMSIAAHAAAQPKPVAIVGSGTRSTGDRRFFQYYVTARLGVVSHDCGDFLDPAEFSRYSMVVWLRSWPEDRKPSPEQSAQMKAYLEAGGHLLMTNGAPYVAFGRRLEQAPWIQANAWAYRSKGWRPKVLQPDDPLLRGVSFKSDSPPIAGETPLPEWLTGPHALLGFRGVRVFGGKGPFTTLGYADVGKGRFLFSTYGAYEVRSQEKTENVMQIYRNAVTAADPLTEHAEAEALLAKAAPGRELAFWQRDWSGSTDRRLLFRPAGPREGEVLDTLEFTSVRGEIDSAFFCVQSRRQTSAVRIQADPLRDKQGKPIEGSPLKVLVMDQAPEVPLGAPKRYGEVDRGKRGPFYLVPPEQAAPEGEAAFRLEPLAVRTVWVQLNTRGLPAGRYASRIVFSDGAGTKLGVLPVSARVAPIRMPDPRLVQLRTWGGSIGADPRLVREMHRQRCDCGVISYPDGNKVRLRNTDVALAQAVRNAKHHLRGKEPPPRLDFTGMWRDPLNLYLDHGLTNLILLDVRTGATWANAISGETCDVTKPFETWPPKWREAFIDYYAQLQEYVSERGYLMPFPLWTDEPSFESIRKNYLPRAKAYMAAGMGPGSHWTTYGWMTPDDVNFFAPWTRDFSMYQYGYPNLQRFLKNGSVRLPEHSIVGFTRGGTGLAVRSPHRSSRLQGWWIVHQGPPAHFLRTGPIWKGWIYYLDYTQQWWFRLGGIQGERLLAYGSSDLNDLSADMCTSSDWEGARDGVDDANLARMVDWYLPRLKRRAEGAWSKRLEAIESERRKWFRKGGPFPIGEKPVDYVLARKGETRLEYHITQADTPSTRNIEAAKRYMIDLLEEMRPHVLPVDMQVTWHDSELVRDGENTATVVVSKAARPEVKQAARSIVRAVQEETNIRLPLVETERSDSLPGLKILVGEATDPLVAALTSELKTQLDSRYPGKGDYRILRLPERKTIAILGVDAAGTERGVRNWLAFLNPQGHWLLP